MVRPSTAFSISRASARSTALRTAGRVIVITHSRPSHSTVNGLAPAGAASRSARTVAAGSVVPMIGISTNLIGAPSRVLVAASPHQFAIGGARQRPRAVGGQRADDQGIRRGVGLDCRLPNEVGQRSALAGPAHPHPYLDLREAADRRSRGVDRRARAWSIEPTFGERVAPSPLAVVVGRTGLVPLGRTEPSRVSIRRMRP